MIHKIQRLCILIIASWALLFSLSQPMMVRAATVDCTRPDLTAKQAIQCGSCNASGINCGNTDPTTTSANTINSTTRNVVNLLSAIAGIIAVVMIIAAGFRFVTGAGNDQAVAGARRTLQYAVIGLLIAALAQVFARFILHQATKG